MIKCNECGCDKLELRYTRVHFEYGIVEKGRIMKHSLGETGKIRVTEVVCEECHTETKREDIDIDIVHGWEMELEHEKNLSL